MNLSLKSQVSLYPLAIRKDKKNYIVEESASGEFFEMPKVCIDAIELINEGKSLEEIEETLKLGYPEEEVNMLDFSEQLLELGLVREIDGHSVENKKRNQQPTGFTWISPVFGRFFFNKVTLKLYLFIFFVNIAIFVIEPGLLPAYRDLFLFDAMMFNVLTFMGISLLLILIHEFGHILAIRSYGLPAELSIGHRLFLVVFQTDLTPAWKLQSNQRNRLYLAGICFDQLLIFVALVVRLLLPESQSLFLGIMGIITLDLFIKTIYQCCFYMKTDLYYLFENITGCYNLMESGKGYLSKWIPFFKQNAIRETFQGEAKTIRLYGLFYICGVVLTLSLFFFYFLPQAYYAYAQVLPELLNPGGNPYFWDAVIFVGQTLILIGLFVYSWMKERIQKEKGLE